MAVHANIGPNVIRKICVFVQITISLIARVRVSIRPGEMLVSIFDPILITRRMFWKKNQTGLFPKVGFSIRPGCSCAYANVGANAIS